MTARVLLCYNKDRSVNGGGNTLVNTKAIGNVGEARVLSELISLGIPVCLPFGDNERYDLVADFNGRLVRIQVKTVGVLSKNGKVATVPLCSARPSRKGSAGIKYTGDVEFIAAVILPWDCVLLLPVEDDTTLTMAFRRERSKVSVSTQNLVDDYLLDATIRRLGVTASETYADSRRDLDRKDGVRVCKPTYEITCPSCKATRVTTSRKRRHCEACLDSGAHIQNPNGKPSRDDLILTIKSLGGNFKRIGAHYGVSDNAVRKWCRGYGLSDKSKHWKARS
mgnify:FL=1